MRCALPQDFPADRSKTVTALDALAAEQNGPRNGTATQMTAEAHLHVVLTKFRHAVNSLLRGIHCRLLSNSSTPSGLPLRVSPS
jgi:hypothetical protein